MTLTLVIRTDKPEAEIGLYTQDNQLAYETWLADRHLSETIHSKINQLLKKNKHALKDLSSIVCFKGPGSFTGLRIGLTVANSLAYGLNIPVVATLGEKWVNVGLKRLKAGEDDKLALPFYGAEPHITQPRK